MKKILLLLASGLLIACMAGSAMAGETILSTDNVQINPNGQAVTDISTSISLPAGTYQTKVYTDNDNLEAWLESSDPIAVGNVNLWAKINPLVTPDYKLTAPRTYTGTLHIRGTGAGMVTVETDKGTTQLKRLYSVESVEVQVPEFPTVAAPVAAVLGLLFVIGRKRGDL